MIARHTECNMLMKKRYRNISFSELALHNYHGLRCIPEKTPEFKKCCVKQLKNCSGSLQGLDLQIKMYHCSQLASAVPGEQ